MGLFSTLPPLHFFLIFFIFISHFFHDLRFSLYLSIKLILFLSFTSFSSSDVIVIRRSSVGCYCKSNRRCSPRCSSEAERRTHNPEVVGSNPTSGILSLRLLYQNQAVIASATLNTATNLHRCGAEEARKAHNLEDT